ncbi:MAG TPA: hypothetical protein VE093_48945 [Polyangiaceae bacterium]|nr:hypothetical protein [Polyangiaceae bacterium]
MHPTLMHGPLHFLFHNAFLHGATSYGESGTKFSLAALPGETILLFRTDDRGEGGKKNDRKGGGTFCSYFNIKDNEKCSDLLLFYAREQPDGAFRYRLAFIELKGTDAAHGVEQLDRVMHAVKLKLPATLKSSFFRPECLRAIILSSRASPNTSSYARRVKEFRDEWRISPELCHPKKEDELRAYLLK